MAVTNWLRKSLVILISILTFGLVTPSDLSWLANAHDIKPDKNRVLEENKSPYTQVVNIDERIPDFDRGQVISEFKSKAEESAYQKFGEKINPKIGDEFRSVILPKIEEAIEEITKQFPDEQLQKLSISESVSGGRSEKIFHIYDTEHHKDVIRFHVRQDNLPLEGYWFNFHYHTYHDSFVNHYDLGSIFWDTNTPPKWGASKIVS